MAWLKECKVVQESYILEKTTALGLRPDTSNLKLQINYCLLPARFFVWCCKVKGKIKSWINFKQILKRNFEIETAGHPKKLELKKWTLLSPFLSAFFLLVFLDERDPKLSRFKQEHKAIYTVANEKHEARLPPFFLFLISFFLYHLFSSSFCLMYFCLFVYLSLKDIFVDICKALLCDGIKHPII